MPGFRWVTQRIQVWRAHSGGRFSASDCNWPLVSWVTLEKILQLASFASFVKWQWELLSHTAVIRWKFWDGIQSRESGQNWQLKGSYSHCYWTVILGYYCLLYNDMSIYYPSKRFQAARQVLLHPHCTEIYLISERLLTSLRSHSQNYGSRP